MGLALRVVAPELSGYPITVPVPDLAVIFPGPEIGSRR
jgi:hypothetical protein